MDSLIVSTTKHKYPIIIDFNLFNKKDLFNFLQIQSQVMIVTNKIIFDLYFQQLAELLNIIGINYNYILIPEGEQYKNLKTLNIIFTKLIQKKCNRDSILIALGGGVIGDLTGLAASLYQRGIRFIQIPTTLLAQVDASIGGKTAVNHILGKNMIGSFYQPISVLINLSCLCSLSKRELSAGIAEIIKYSIIFDKDFFYWLELNIQNILNLEPISIKYCVFKCCELKAKIVEKDEYENNQRALLNLGHTFGHAIETEVGYGTWLHGEAISVGIILSSLISEELQLFKHKETIRIINLLKMCNLPIKCPNNINIKNFLKHILVDKKVYNNNVRIIIPINIGKAIIFNKINTDIIITSFNRLQNLKI
ncbi:3-dehydroquinate synthase [Enterobacteriaceae endosymbiont of Neohaemonia nigricornis]|uniref:3-dehydroquinate synthase n=1 Tax=Enterobacteriaceae endosymbiont of Neohaemonia nigricornis TaxID=2675792 RepID=UPI0014492753|nr:3-dehydroquinate synthase [Enterobacteriaceae endosymbiont of Neohaemonia nigricornis]QJC30629.1 3-dehydroquinate synthase [Enterobacteriaceae endosymbiont of Neohaemonia nigricornis]